MSIYTELKHYANDLSLLVVEDEIELCNELVEIASMFFKQVDFANNGQEALEKYKSNKYDLILSDITMPKMNGIKLSAELRNIDKNIPIVILSAHSELEYLIQLIDIGVNQFVAKPFNPEELYYKLLKVSENLIHKRNFNEHYGNKTIEKSEVKNEIQLVREIKKTQEIKKVEEVEVVKPKAPTISSEKLLSHKVEDASNFMEKLEENELSYLILDDQIESLVEYAEDFSRCVNRIYLNKFDKKTIIEIAGIITSIRNIFLLMNSLDNLTYTLEQISNYLIDLDFDSLDKSQKDKLKILEFICDDISRYIDTVFVYKDTVDIYYLEDSLNSSFEQLKMNLGDQDFEEEELDLF